MEAVVCSPHTSSLPQSNLPSHFYSSAPPLLSRGGAPAEDAPGMRQMSRPRLPHAPMRRCDGPACTAEEMRLSAFPSVMTRSAALYRPVEARGHRGNRQCPTLYTICRYICILMCVSRRLPVMGSRVRRMAPPATGGTSDGRSPSGCLA